MQKYPRSITHQRFDRFTSKTQFSDVNLIALLWKETVNLSAVEYYHSTERISFAQATKQAYISSNVADLVMGPSWSTYWFKVSLTIPLSMKGEKVYLLFDPSCEALIFNPSGLPLQGITGGTGQDRHVDFLLAESAKGGETIPLFIEVALNGMFGNPGAEAGIITAPDPERTFKIATYSIAAINQPAQDLLWDFDIIKGIAKEDAHQLSADALYTANAIVNSVRYDVPESINLGLEIARNFFQTRKDYGYADHLIVATGHCHIDSAWLWPYGETKRKCARSFATQCDLMDKYPEYKFSCSQAQQFEWIEQDYPLLFERIKEKVKIGQFVPVGGTWVLFA